MAVYSRDQVVSNDIFLLESAKLALGLKIMAGSVDWFSAESPLLGADRMAHDGQPMAVDRFQIPECRYELPSPQRHPRWRRLLYVVDFHTSWASLVVFDALPGEETVWPRRGNLVVEVELTPFRFWGSGTSGEQPNGC